MGLVNVIDIETKEESQIEVDSKFFDTIYRNRNTRALDERLAHCLENKSSPIAFGSCFTGGEYILPVFVQIAEIAGFYFGVEKSAIDESRQSYLSECESEGTIEIVNYGGKEIVLPIEFK